MPKHRQEKTTDASDLRTTLGAVGGIEQLQELISETATDRTDGATETGQATEMVGTNPDSAEQSDLPLDQLFEILKNQRRRRVMNYLRTHDGNTALGTLAEHIAAKENDTTVRQITSSQRKRVYVGLYQCHLPKMDDMRIIDFEKNRGNVTLDQNAELLEPYLERQSSEEEWPLVYGSVAVVGLVASVVALALPAAVAVVVAVLSIVALSCCVGVHLFQTRRGTEDSE